MNKSKQTALFSAIALSLIALPIIIHSLLAEEKKTESLLAKPDRNNVNLQAKNLPVEWDVEEGTNVKWKAKLGSTSYGGPVVAKGKVFVGTNNDNPRDKKHADDMGVLMCFQQSDGKFLWQATHEKLESEENDYPRQGIASSPVVDGEYVYYVSNRAEVCCAHVDGDGKGGAKFKWKYDMIKELKVFPCFLANCSPLIVGDLVFVVTGNGTNEEHELPSPKAASFIAIEKDTGNLAWYDNSPGEHIMEGQWASPTFANPGGKKPMVIFPGGDGWLYAFEPKSGKLYWKFFCNARSSKYDPKNMRISNRAYFLASPVVIDDRCFIGVGTNPDDGPGEGHFWCIDISKEPANSDKDLSPVKDNFDPKAPINTNSGLVWHFGGKITPKPKEGRELYFGRTLSTPAIHEGLIYISELDGYFHCLDAKTGKRIWLHDLTTGVWASPYYADGKVYLGTEDGDVMVFKHGKEKKVLAQNLFGPPIKTPVTADGKVLYAMTDGYLYAIEKK